MSPTIDNKFLFQFMDMLMDGKVEDCMDGDDPELKNGWWIKPEHRRKLEILLPDLPSKDICMCGDDMNNHPVTDHAPMSQYEQFQHTADWEPEIDEYCGN